MNNITEEALKLVRTERYRVINEEGFTHLRDAIYRDHELIRAASAYIMSPIFYPGNYRLEVHQEKPVPIIWPFNPSWYKPTDDRKRELVKGIQFALAELEQLLINETKSE